MKDSLLKALKIDKVIEALIQYIEAKAAVYKEEAKVELQTIFARLFVDIVFAFLGLGFIFFFGFFLANYLNAITKSQFIGYGIIAAFFLICLIAVALIKNQEFFKKISLKFTMHIFKQK